MKLFFYALNVRIIIIILLFIEKRESKNFKYYLFNQKTNIERFN